MQQLRRLDAEAVEEQLQELALVGQQAAATLASQERALFVRTTCLPTSLTKSPSYWQERVLSV